MLEYSHLFDTAKDGGGGLGLNRNTSAQLFESFDDNSGGDTDLDIIVKDPKKHCTLASNFLVPFIFSLSNQSNLKFHIA